MAPYDPNSNGNNPLNLYRASVRYPEFPEDIDEQRTLITIFHHGLNGKKGKHLSLDDAKPTQIQEAAHKMWKKAHRYVGSLTPEETEDLRLKATRKNGSANGNGHIDDKVVIEEPLLADWPGCDRNFNPEKSLLRYAVS